MKATVIAAASALAIAPALTCGVLAGQANSGSWSFSDYTPDPSSLAADNAFHTTTGTAITSWCHGSRVPSAPQDVTSRRLTVAAPTVLKLDLDAAGAWGVDVVRSGKALAGATTAQASNAAALSVRLRPGTYVVKACNLGGAPTATVNYRLARTR
jgi:hypothetical protein